MKFFLLFFLFIGSLSAERVALLIGNNSYKYISDLNDPSNNLKRLKDSLESLDFQVKIKTNLDSIALESSIDNFVSQLHNNTIGFLYYTGHGCQVDYQGYLVPTNIDTHKKIDIKYRAFNINAMLDKFKEAKNRVNMLFLDACRDIPTGTRGATKGLGQPTNTPNGSLVVYATKAGEVAEDNSYFIDALIDNITLPNQSVRDLGDNISLSVAQKSSHHQIPVVYSMLLPKIVLKRGEDVVIHSTPTPKILSIHKIANLIYQSQPSLEKFTWQEAKKYCSNIKLQGYSNWSLPSKRELSIILKDETIKGKEIHLWSKTKAKGSTVWAIDVDENNWYKSDTPNSWRNPNLCVRKNEKGERK